MSTALANIDSNLMKAGRPVSFPAFVAATGADLATKDGKKLARTAYGKLQAEFSRQASTALGAAVSSGQFETVKLNVEHYADGRKKITAVLAEPKAATKPANKLAAANAEIEDLKAQIAALKAK